MEKTMKIEGMMCGHCEARVKKALEALPEVDQAEVSHEAVSYTHLDVYKRQVLLQTGHEKYCEYSGV